MMKLNECPVRTAIRITEVPVPKSHQLRMQEIGVRVGAHASIVQRAGFGGLILNIAGSRVAIDHRFAKLIEAELS
ncbi:MAG: FeoA family protein [Arcanobacterium sp.]|nr:FeoA family protein [Arcanobacterium sp.]